MSWSNEQILVLIKKHGILKSILIFLPFKSTPHKREKFLLSSFDEGWVAGADEKIMKLRVGELVFLKMNKVSCIALQNLQGKTMFIQQALIQRKILLRSTEKVCTIIIN